MMVKPQLMGLTALPCTSRGGAETSEVQGPWPSSQVHSPGIISKAPGLCHVCLIWCVGWEAPFAPGHFVAIPSTLPSHEYS